MFFLTRKFLGFASDTNIFYFWVRKNTFNVSNTKILYYQIICIVHKLTVSIGYIRSTFFANGNIIFIIKIWVLWSFDNFRIYLYSVLTMSLYLLMYHVTLPHLTILSKNWCKNVYRQQIIIIMINFPLSHYSCMNPKPFLEKEKKFALILRYSCWRILIKR